jgi:histidyl-tRNA synthetase
MGMERLLLLLEQLDNLPIERGVDVYLILVGTEAEKEGMCLAEKIRNEIDGIKLQVNCGQGSFKSQFKKADRSGAEFALVLADDEVSRGEVSIKPLRSDEEQKKMTQTDVFQFLRESI